MDSHDFVLVEGLRGTRGILNDWNHRPLKIVGPWLLGALAIALALLGTVLLIATTMRPDPTPFTISGLNSHASVDDVFHILFKNGLVLALHGFACVAGFIAGSSLPAEAERYSGHWRWIHDKAGPLAIAFVSAATLFSLLTQAYALGDIAATTANYLHMPPGTLLLGLSLHAIPELTALFLPLAAWIIASRRDEWDHLLAATFVTVGFAVPVLILCAVVEVYLSPDLVLALRG
ncbi:MAG TPA: hypothetical protein VNT22_09465 [Baekduia sp.]|nr:hypothetical protein [Baekduia sp.]